MQKNCRDTPVFVKALFHQQTIFHLRFLVPTYGGALQLMPYDISKSMHTILLQSMVMVKSKRCLDYRPAAAVMHGIAISDYVTS